MKKEIEVTFGEINETPETEVKEELKAVKPADNSMEEDVVTVTEKTEVEQEDAYASAVDRLFEEYQAFQVGMNKLPQLVKNPAVMQLNLMKLLKTFKEEIQLFRNAEYNVDDMYKEGHHLILQGLDKYDVFLVEYPKALEGKNGFKAMKKIKDLGTLSGKADQDMKAAFRSFDQAIQGGTK